MPEYFDAGRLDRLPAMLVALDVPRGAEGPEPVDERDVWAVDPTVGMFLTHERDQARYGRPPRDCVMRT
jgi:hypothetical protein